MDTRGTYDGSEATCATTCDPCESGDHEGCLQHGYGWVCTCPCGTTKVDARAVHEATLSEPRP